MGRGRSRNRKRNGVVGKNLTPLSSMALDQKEKRIFDLRCIGPGPFGPHQFILHELPLQKIRQQIDDGPGDGDVSITAKDLPIITLEATAASTQSYSFIDAAAVGLDSRIYHIGGLCVPFLREAHILREGYRSGSLSGEGYEDDGCTPGFYRIGGICVRQPSISGSFSGEGYEDYGCTPGCNRGSHAEVFCLEIDGGQPNDKEWKRCCPMNIGRKNPLACAVDGKIYVFGGAWHGRFIGEVYNPVEDRWETLPPLEDFWASESPIAPMNVVVDDPEDAGNKLILVNIQGTQPLYAFNVRKNDWDCFDKGFGLDPRYPYNDPRLRYREWPTNAVVDNFLYCYSLRRGFFGYDLNEKEWHDLKGKGWHRIHGILEEASDGFENIPSLFHLGGNTLCFLWSYDIFCGELPDVLSESDVIIGCAKFKVVGTNIDKSSQSLRLGYFRSTRPAYGDVHFVRL
ncbi:Kelch repeat type 1 [Corchorus olitorius]|uniref:Kelch repeat type 1 n=1 Tax=Corchorus olitorius TaxID=93759 RepID=A0A1R3KBU6_9ROSI|nr:Kelch repeat type 1 [Corchorus olitorius]